MKDERKKMNFAWVIEDLASEIHEPRYWSGRHGWTSDAYKAVRFARKEDAESAASALVEPDQTRVREHGWED